MSRIYCVEDDEDIRNLIVYALNNQGFISEGFGHYKDFYQALDRALPDLIILDIMLPDKDGLTILKELKADPRLRQLPIIFVTAKSSEFSRVKGLDLGADDYMVKPFSVMEMISRVKAVLRRSQKPASKSLEFKELFMDYDRRQVDLRGQQLDLTYKEFELLYLLLENRELVLTRDTLLERVWGYDFLGDTRTVDVHIASLRKKLGDYGNYIQTLRNVGYKIGELL